MYICIVDMQMMCRPNDLISLTFFLWELYGEIWGTPFSHGPCKFQLHHSLASTWCHGCIPKMCSSSLWEMIEIVIPICLYIYTMKSDITYICTDMNMYMAYMLGSNLHIIFKCERSFVCLFPRLIHPLLTYTTSGCRALESQKLLIKLWFSPIMHGNTIHEASIPCPPNVSVGKKCMFAQFISDGPGPRILPVCEVDSK